jgi:hypothetical protein
VAATNTLAYYSKLVRQQIIKAASHPNGKSPITLRGGKPPNLHKKAQLAEVNLTHYGFGDLLFGELLFGELM